MCIRDSHHYLDRKREFACNTLIEVIKRETGRLLDVERFIRLTLFDALIGNHDRHGRNLALIETPSGKALSPFYDNHSYLAIEDENLLAAKHSPRGKITTSTSPEPTLADYTYEFRTLGYGEIVEQFRALVDIEHITTLIEDSFISRKRKAALQQLVTERANELN